MRVNYYKVIDAARPFVGYQRPVGGGHQARMGDVARAGDLVTCGMSLPLTEHKWQQLRGGSEGGAGQSKGFYWRSKTSLAFTCPVSTSWIAELTSSSWRRS